MNPIDINALMRDPIRFTIPLTFPDEDKKQYPWLNNPDRYYKIEKQLGKGGFSLAFLGVPCDAAGVQYPGSDPVVIKIPNLSPDHLSRDTMKRLGYIQIQSITEWEIIRKKLISCKNANPIFDMGSIWVAGPPMTEIYVTAQPFLLSATPLRQWLVDQKLRGEILYDQKGDEVNWHGIGNWTKWLSVATIIGDGLAEIHKHRIVHGDIWPPNIYVRDVDGPYPVFIDFGESFLVMPSGEPRTQPDHPYRAPEREKAESVKTEQVDVYSFGKLMLYLAIGDNKVIPRSPGNQLIYGHKRRAWVRKILFESNPELVRARPEIVDLISQCVECDPAGRPTILEVCDQLHELSAEQTPIVPRLDVTVSRIQNIVSAAHLSQSNAVFLRLVDRKITEAERLIEGCDKDMVEITGTRDVLIAALVALFGELHEGDSWTSLTTPSVWQHSALGLDGRYSTATIHALRRKAAVHRVYSVSVEELGVKWTGKLIQSLKATGRPELKQLAAEFETAVSDCNHMPKTEGTRRKSPAYIRQHQQRFALAIHSLHDIVRQWDLENLLHVDKFDKIQTTKGAFFGLTPVGTEAKIRELRAQNPVSIMYSSRNRVDRDKWLLVMTDIIGRNENEPIDDRPEAPDLGPSNAPQLRRVRVYRSVMGVPTDRILSLETFLRDGCTNIGPLLGKLGECVSAVG